MADILVMVLLMVVAGWLDSRLNWRQAVYNEQETPRS